MAHRLLKNHAAELIGHGAYALITEPAASYLEVPDDGARAHRDIRALSADCHAGVPAPPDVIPTDVVDSVDLPGFRRIRRPAGVWRDTPLGTGDHQARDGQRLPTRRWQSSDLQTNARLWPSAGISDHTHARRAPARSQADSCTTGNRRPGFDGTVGGKTSAIER